jgi:UDP-glucose 4-epimerase
MRGIALVTGGAGFIGSHLARALVARGHAVRVLDDLSVGRRSRVPAEAGFVLGDVRSGDDVRKALEGVEIVFHQAARVSIRSSLKEFHADADINLMGTLNLLRCLAGTEVRKVVFASSMAVYADSDAPVPIDEDHPKEPLAPYGIAKLAAEKYCLQLSRELGVACHVLRYFNTFGPGQTFTPYVGVITIFIRRLLEGRPPIVYGDGRQSRDFVHVDDVVQANLLSMGSALERAVFNVGTGRATTLNEIAALLCGAIDPRLRPEHVAAHPGELRYSIADVRRIGASLGYRPTVTLADRVHEVIAWQRAEAERRTRGDDPNGSTA